MNPTVRLSLTLAEPDPRFFPDSRLSSNLKGNRRRRRQGAGGGENHSPVLLLSFGDPLQFQSGLIP